MRSKKRAPLPPGHQVWDPANGVRVGTIVGAMAGAGVMATTGVFSFWMIVVPGGVGACLGYWSVKRNEQGPPKSPQS